MDGGEDYASRGVILVQVTYRLGSMGFFSHPLLSEESPNGYQVIMASSIRQQHLSGSATI
jgi:carboxylesterase type B